MNILRRYRILFFGVFLAGAMPAISQAGWEVSGGDSYALQFVKIGRVFADQFPNNPACRFGAEIDLESFRQAIETSEVSTVNQDLPSVAKEISVNRLTWPWMTNRSKIETILKAYTKDSAKPFHKTIPEAAADACIASASVWGAVFPAIPTQRVTPVVVSQDIPSMAKLLIERLADAPSAEVLKHFDYQKLEAAVPQISVGTEPVAMKLFDSQIKDGLNFKDKNRHAARLLINQPTWQQMDKGQRMELLLHEYLSVIGSNDKHYQISSLLYRDLPPQDYVK